LVAFSGDGNVIAVWPKPNTQLSFVAGEVRYVGFDINQALTLRRRGDQRRTPWTLKLVACTDVKGAPALNLDALNQPSVQEIFGRRLGAARPVRGLGPRKGSLTGSGRAAEQPSWYDWNFRLIVTGDA
jgi:hypothetical protein